MTNRAVHQCADSTTGNYVVGVHIFMETHRRLLKGAFGRIPKPISEDAFSMGSYCLDAPEVMPGGGMFYNEFAPPEDGEPQWVPSQFIVHRWSE
jgi:hypothetical protein